MTINFCISATELYSGTMIAKSPHTGNPTQPTAPPTPTHRSDLPSHYFQMERARMMSEKRTLAALESLSVPMTMRIAQDSNWA